MVDFNLVNLDVSLLGTQYNVRNGIGTSSFAAPSSAAQSRTPAVITPWAEEDDRSLLSRYNQIRNKTNFINENTSAVREAGFDKDNKALFTIYSAINDLRTIAEYASDSGTLSSQIAGLSTQFQTGLSQVDDYIKSAELDKLILMAGEKKSYVTTESALGKDDRDYVGGVVAAVSDTAPILGLNGDEVFTINIDTISENEDITIDLSEISGTVSLENLKDLINQKISEITTLNNEGQTVGKYKTRASVEEVEDGKFALKFDIDGIEKISFSAASSDPALIVAGTERSGDFGSIIGGTLTKYSNIDSADPTKSFSTEIQGIDENGFVIPADSDDEGATETQSTTVTFNTTPVALQVDSQGNTFVVGTTEGDLGGQINGAETSDVFLSKYSSTGELLWSRLVGASDQAEAFDIAIDANDNVVIAGKTNEELITSDVFAGTDSFVSKFSSSGEELWTQQLDTIATDQANSLTVDANGDVYFTGQVSGRIDATTTANGGEDVTLVKLDGDNGIVREKVQYGGAGDDIGKNIAIADDGNLLVLAEEDGNAVIRKLDANDLTNTLATYDIGDLDGGEITGIAVDGTDVYVTGTTLSGSLNGGTVANSYSGGRDGFVTKLSDNGGSFSADFTTYVGTAASDSIADLSIANGSVYVAGTTTGTLSGESKTGITDGFVTKIDATSGSITSQDQLGGIASGYNDAAAISFVANGSSVLDKLGLQTGTIDNDQTRNIETQTSAREGDYFYISVNGGRDIKIDIREGDTYDTLATRINTYSTRNLKATVTYGDEGPALKIQAQNGSTVEFKAGEDGRDALSKLGLEERSIIASEVLFDLDDSDEIDPNDLGGIFALGLNNAFNFGNKQEAEYIMGALDDALRVIESAHRSLTFDPLKAQLLAEAKNNFGPAPAHLQERLSRYQDGLQRVLAVTGGTII
ncbi:hypothetical protein [Pseudemcibacter aquimaris]|uniref:hypothetical protein n=1 Tax=Pseudemcibacter aquimaris TaxID=2857064 RepID=UPI002011C089|nr:hypothetical protein [Pseudemcibacter aquimaris]MCC3861935.1 hypothetical protein [Pseudemcibacter aquimaris]WDU58687.1 hypothetical protein KW060_00175 [Pseudemcibacter aquimaris]